MPEGELTREDLRRLSAELDSTGQATLPESKSGTQEVDAVDSEEDSSPSQEELEEKFKREREKADKSKTDEEEDEEEDSKDEDEEEEESSESSVAEKKKAKDKERQDRSWKKLEEEKRALREEREKFEAERNGSATLKRIKTVDDVREAKDPSGFSVADYEYAAKKYEEEGESDKAEKLKEAAKNLFVKTFSEEWSRNTNEMIEEHPELSDSRKPLTQAVNKCLESLPFLKMIPDGIRYAVRISLGDSSAALLSELKSENRKLKKQLEVASRRTRLVGSGPARGETTFEGQDVLSLPKERRKAYLRELAAQADGTDY